MFFGRFKMYSFQPYKLGPYLFFSCPVFEIQNGSFLLGGPQFISTPCLPCVIHNSHLIFNFKYDSFPQHVNKDVRIYSQLCFTLCFALICTLAVSIFDRYTIEHEDSSRHVSKFFYILYSHETP